eukprot:SAG31_NODE_823_length_11772_cov_10.262229_3_plen_1580_part_00
MTSIATVAEVQRWYEDQLRIEVEAAHRQISAAADQWLADRQVPSKFPSSLRPFRLFSSQQRKEHCHLASLLNDDVWQTQLLEESNKQVYAVMRDAAEQIALAKRSTPAGTAEAGLQAVSGGVSSTIARREVDRITTELADMKQQLAMERLEKAETAGRQRAALQLAEAEAAQDLENERSKSATRLQLIETEHRIALETALANGEKTAAAAAVAATSAVAEDLAFARAEAAASSKQRQEHARVKMQLLAEVQAVREEGDEQRRAAEAEHQLMLKEAQSTVQLAQETASVARAAAAAASERHLEAAAHMEQVAAAKLTAAVSEERNRSETALRSERAARIAAETKLSKVNSIPGKSSQQSMLMSMDQYAETQAKHAAEIAQCQAEAAAQVIAAVNAERQQTSEQRAFVEILRAELEQTKAVAEHAGAAQMDAVQAKELADSESIKTRATSDSRLREAVLAERARWEQAVEHAEAENGKAAAAEKEAVEMLAAAEARLSEERSARMQIEAQLADTRRLLKLSQQETAAAKQGALEAEAAASSQIEQAMRKMEKAEEQLQVALMQQSSELESAAQASLEAAVAEAKADQEKILQELLRQDRTTQVSKMEMVYEQKLKATKEEAEAKLESARMQAEQQLQDMETEHHKKLEATTTEKVRSLMAASQAQSELQDARRHHELVIQSHMEQVRAAQTQASDAVATQENSVRNHHEAIAELKAHHAEVMASSAATAAKEMRAVEEAAEIELIEAQNQTENTIRNLRKEAETMRRQIVADLEIEHARSMETEVTVMLATHNAAISEWKARVTEAEKRNSTHLQQKEVGHAGAPAAATCRVTESSTQSESSSMMSKGSEHTLLGIGASDLKQTTAPKAQQASRDGDSSGSATHDNRSRPKVKFTFDLDGSDSDDEGKAVAQQLNFSSVDLELGQPSAQDATTATAVHVDQSLPPSSPAGLSDASTVSDLSEVDAPTAPQNSDDADPLDEVRRAKEQLRQKTAAVQRQPQTNQTVGKGVFSDDRTQSSDMGERMVETQGSSLAHVERVRSKKETEESKAVCVGDAVEVYSRSMKRWMSGRVTADCDDGDVIVVYTDGKGSEWEKPVDPADRGAVRQHRAKAESAGMPEPAVESPGKKAGKGLRKAAAVLQSETESRAATSSMRASVTNSQADGPSQQPDQRKTSGGPANTDTIDTTAEVDSSDAIVMEEQIKAEPPSEHEIHEYARWLGINPDDPNDEELMWMAREGIDAPLPPQWKPIQQGSGGPVYYFNFETEESTWDHPSDLQYKKLYRKHRKAQRKREKLQAAGLTPSTAAAVAGAATPETPAPRQIAMDSKPDACEPVAGKNVTSVQTVGRVETPKSVLKKSSAVEAKAIAAAQRAAKADEDERKAAAAAAAQAEAEAVASLAKEERVGSAAMRLLCVGLRGQGAQERQGLNVKKYDLKKNGSKTVRLWLQPTDDSPTDSDGNAVDWVVCWGGKLGKVSNALRVKDLRYITIGVAPPASPAVSTAYGKLLTSKAQAKCCFVLLGPERPFHFLAPDSDTCRTAVAAIAHLLTPLNTAMTEATAVHLWEQRDASFRQICNVALKDVLR